jgi:hypothetical protein
MYGVTTDETQTCIYGTEKVSAQAKLSSIQIYQFKMWHFFEIGISGGLKKVITESEQ